ncbi:amino acid adenylation domain-containing protein [Actinopolyspora mzabensis]|uniref:Amino acid adenylation domain-containing protein n=1 Tax=Actinopolyspora mzabensis TaxID=995066 RepID=A0A1G8Y365_ACTMZ|nr:non-ribosomal peptide synthetase [Actinopolyspora mzabensis]SDJ97309.1 amino acid adenylation domain-containing protein [Actinopolyspora mzabensis]
MTESVHECFSAQVARTPDAKAVSGDGGALSYRELDERANRLARKLREFDVQRDVPVAVFMRRSPNVVIAFLAALKAGGFYQPLHSAYPAELRQRIIDHSNARILVTDDSVPSSELPAVDAVIDLSEEHGPVSESAPEVTAEGDATAYVMYTSGSTGEPKGVAVRHRDVLDLVLDSMWDTGNHERVLMLAPHAFNVSTYEIWVPLLRGGQVIVAPEDALDVTSLSERISANAITALHLTAGLFRVVAEEEPQSLSGVREVLTGGDVIPPNAVERVLKHCGQTVVRAMYGATEATVFSTNNPLTAPYTASTRVPVGSGRDGVEAHVLDERLDPLPDGAVGELYLAGSGIALGYVGRPDLTSARFVANPFATDGTRMYRTGDLVRRNPEGMLEYVGRASEQVKILGFRADLGEIESVLGEHPGLTQVTVVARAANDDEDKRLIAYVVAGSKLPDEAEMRDFLRTRLPPYLIPSAFVPIEALPMTANGKLDRSRLPLPEFKPQPDHRQPEGPKEQALCAAFAEILGLAEVGPDDSFFDLGGHSLLAMRLINRIRSELGVTLRITTLFDTPTAAGLASAI